MPIIACGINHKTAPIELREKIIFPAEKLALYLQDLLANENINEAVLLSTCNRSELYCHADDTQQVIEWFHRQHPVSANELNSIFYLHQDEAAVRHIMQVACGLDSMILGESQILGQMKQAFSESCVVGTVGTVFNRLFQQIFAVAKEVRTNTAIGACPMSVSSAAVSFIKEHFTHELKNQHILVLGAGVTSELVVRHLSLAKVLPITVINRSLDNALALTKKYSCKAAPFTELMSALMQADILVTGTGSTSPLITPSLLGQRHKPLFIVDIAVPRDVERAVAAIPLVSLYSIDDLRHIIQNHLQGREHAAEKAREMIMQRSQEYMTWLISLDKVAATIRTYRQQIEKLRDAELSKAMRQLERGEDPLQVLISFAHLLTQKLLHTPSVQLRQAGFEGRWEVLQLAQQLFAIPLSAS